MAFKINDTVTWVGKIDWELRRFHGEEFSTHRGSSYNSYLIQDTRTVLIDTVWGPFAQEFVEHLKQVIDLKKIDYIIANHAETDHSGSLAGAAERDSGHADLLHGKRCQVAQGPVSPGLEFQGGEDRRPAESRARELIFIEAPMLHWPDTMFCYLTGDNILFSNDAFGQHYASELMYQ